MEIKTRTNGQNALKDNHFILVLSIAIMPLTFKNLVKPGVMVQEDVYELFASLVYIASSRTGGAP